MGFSVYCLAFNFEFNNHKTKACKQSICREESVIIWFTFKPGLELTGFQATLLRFQKVNLTWARDPIEHSTWSAVILIKHVISMSYKLESAIWSRDTGQRIAWFDRCQLIITWCHISKKYTVNQGSILFGVWPPCCATPPSPTSLSVRAHEKYCWPR